MVQRYVSVCLNLKFSFLKSCVIALATFAYLTARLVNIFLPQRHSHVVFYVLNSGLVGDPSLSKHYCDGMINNIYYSLLLSLRVNSIGLSNSI